MNKILNYMGMDGLLHILCSLILVNVINIFSPLWFAVLITAMIGLGKEYIWDRWLGKGTFDKKDLFCDLIGILLGCL